MTREEAKKLLPIIQAFAEGKKIEYYNNNNNNWIETSTPVWQLGVKYRIKPEPKYRPFKNQEECWNEMLKHQPFGWFRSAFNENLFNIIGINNDGIKITNTLTKSMETYSQAFKSLKFTDGTPVGIKEE